jgi:imidazoleglycerol-phosphate dehydratase
MKTAVLLYEGFSAREFSALYEPLALAAAQRPMALTLTVCAANAEVCDAQGMRLAPVEVVESLAAFDLVALPGGPGAACMADDAATRAWLGSLRPEASLALVGNAALLLGAAGRLVDRRVAVPPALFDRMEELGALPVSEPLVFEAGLASAADAQAALELGEGLAFSLAAGLPLQIIAGAAEDATDALLRLPRHGHVERKTGETEVKVSVNLDGSGQHRIATGLPFLDHMLTQVAVHGLFDLEIEAHGDLAVDPHHTMEDVGLTLGAAFLQALGERIGLVRMGASEVPMDECLAAVTLDFSGRPYAVFQGEWTLPTVGGLPNTLFEHFFESFAQSARCNLHARILYGRDDHHKAEALFKALGRAACAATRLEPRRPQRIPSSKGMLA